MAAEARHMAGAAKPAGRRRVEALDGLRALAIAGVIAYHAWPATVPGGFLGVTVFFVLTGYLITRSILRTRARGGFSYGRYLWRRVVRVAPATWACIGVTCALTWRLALGLLPKVHTDALLAALFVSNWGYILRQVSYFAAAGLPSPITHLWFLGVTMQFYLVWPAVLLALLAVTRGRRRRAAVAVGVLAVASAALMAWLYDPMGDTARIYYGTDTRLAELLCGAVAALVPRRTAGGKGSALASAGCLVYAAALVAAFFLVDSTWDVVFRGGYLGLAAVTALVVRVLSGGRARAAGRMLGAATLAAVGRRSMQLYLWHYPLLILLNPANRTTALPWWGWVLELALVAAVAEVAYRLFERGGGVRPVAVTLGALGLAAAVAVTFAPVDWDAITAAATGGTQERQEAVDQGSVQESAAEESSAEEPAVEEESAADEDQPTNETACVPEAEVVPANLDASGWTYDPATGTCDADVLIIGDSVTEGAQYAIEELLPNAYVDAEVSRQLWVGQDVYAEDVAAGHDASVVIMALGGNSLIRDEGTVQTVIDAVGGKPLYFVTIRCPYPLQDANNEILRRFAAEYDNVGIIDWYGESVGHDDWIVSDGQHLTTAGCEAYARLLRRALCGH